MPTDDETDKKNNSKSEVTLLSDPSTGATARASSVLQRNVKLYGPMNALDIQDGSSCWYSDGEEGSTQSLSILFGRKVVPTQITIQFQAGFASESCQVFLRNNNNKSSWDLLEEIEPSDAHEVQTFTFEKQQQQDQEPASADAIKIVFDEFTDFYGRVTIYQLGVYGREVVEVGSDSKVK